MALEHRAPLRRWSDGHGAVWVSRLLDESERGRYDAFVRQSPRGNPLQLWSWGEVKRADGWTPLRVLAECNGVPRAAVSLVEKPLGDPSGPTFWLAHRGPVLDPGDSGPSTTLWAGLCALAAQRRVVALRCDPEWPPSEGVLLRRAGLAPLPPHHRWYLGALEPLRVWRISLEGGVPGVLSRCEAHTRYDIRRSQRRGAVVRLGVRADLPDFYALERDIARKKGFSLRADEFFDRLWEAWNEPGDGRLFVATHEGTFIGGAWWVRCGQGCWGQFSAADYAARGMLPAVAL